MMAGGATPVDPRLRGNDGGRTPFDPRAGGRTPAYGAKSGSYGQAAATPAATAPTPAAAPMQDDDETWGAPTPAPSVSRTQMARPRRCTHNLLRLPCIRNLTIMVDRKPRRLTRRQRRTAELQRPPHQLQCLTTAVHTARLHQHHMEQHLHQARTAAVRHQATRQLPHREVMARIRLRVRMPEPRQPRHSHSSTKNATMRRRRSRATGSSKVCASSSSSRVSKEVVSMGNTLSCKLTSLACRLSSLIRIRKSSKLYRRRV